MALLTATSFTFFAFVPLPPAYYPVPLFHRPEEFVPAAFFLTALIGYLRKGQWRYDVFEHWLVLSLIVGVLSQAMFMSLSDELFDTMFDSAHLLKQISHTCVLVGLLINMLHLFRRAESGVEVLAQREASLEREVAEHRLTEERLAKSNRELIALNEDLDSFVYSASHDLRQPLRAMEGFSQILLEDHGKLLDS